MTVNAGPITGTRIKPSSLITVIQLVSSAIVGTAGIVTNHPELALGALVVANSAASIAPYLMSIGD